ncbi:hypothetical protein SAMN04488130_1103 [Flavobacterium urumqiense]|uniref:Uncharacterized protein n=1 Tax=Flavobacterium urumqiense TaxID=935224 RepID=A0A1H5ZD41_9FLAO|nr:hypothetical protein SAMN04488130_1103 [Flavobacterium urumqiense]
MEVWELKLLKKIMAWYNKKVEEALVMENRYRRLFESAKDEILILNVELSRIININPILI